jgi:hypothetical protein
MSKRCWTLQDSFESQYAVSFYPLLLSDTKCSEILQRAMEIRDVRNDISEVFFQNMLAFQDMKKFDAQVYFNSLFSSRLSSHYLKMAITDVWKAYQLRFNAIRKRIEFVKIVELTRVLYKRNTKEHKKGDLKSIDKKTAKTKLTKVLTWLARYGKHDTVDWLQKAVLKTCQKEAKQKLYATLLEYINKYGFSRLMNLALMRRERVYAKYEELGKVDFVSLTFDGRSRISRPIIDRARNENGKFEYYIEISWDWAGDGYHGEHKNTMCIPVKYNKKYHRNLKRYCNGTDTSYKIVIKNNKIHFVLTREGERYKHDEEITEANTIGIDVNSKHNMFALSTGEFIPNDIDIVADLESELLKIDNKQSKYNNRFAKNEKHDPFKMSRKDKARIEAITTKLNESNKRTIAELCKRLSEQGIKHVAMENLTGFQGSKLFAKDAQGLNLGRLHLRTGLSSLKNEFIHIAPKYGILVSLIQPEYTSKMCSHCGCIDDLNRKTQEEFCCIDCGYAENADIHSAKNIKFRLTSTVLRGHLLEKVGDSGYSFFQPKSLFRWQVRKELEQFRSGTLLKQCAENHKLLASSNDL